MYLGTYTNESPGPTFDFNPRSLVPFVPVSVFSARNLNDSMLDAIFVPFRRRYRYVNSLLSELLILDIRIPIFLLPSTPDDYQSLHYSETQDVRLLNISDNRFRHILRDFQAPRHNCCFSFCGNWDLPLKRNFALWYARSHGFKRILLLDDDIRGLTRRQLSAAAECLEDYSVAGYFVEDFPDTSVVGHIEIELGMTVWTFLSGSCLFIRADTQQSYFPPIYNEDWLFMLPQIINGRVCALGRIAQEPYDPFREASLPRFQEFGEIIADGLYALAASDLYAYRLDVEIWRYLLDLRRIWLIRLSQLVSGGRKLAAARTAIKECFHITEYDCVKFLEAWEIDRQLWDLKLQGISR